MERPEIVIGLVGALGVDLQWLSKCIEKSLDCAKYSVRLVRLSELIKRTLEKTPEFKSLKDTPYDEHVRTYQDGGKSIRRKTQRADALALAACARIREIRAEHHNDMEKPIDGVAYLLRSLKTRGEVLTLRKIYGSAFVLISANAPREMRVNSVAAHIAGTHHAHKHLEFRSTAEDLVRIDEDEHDEFGQDVQHAFPLADFFVDTRDRHKAEIAIQRFVEILFGHPFRTPIRDEAAMFHAMGAALRSADLSRQVGAAITDRDGTLIVVGTNEVPHPGGGQYWEGDDGDDRDFVRGSDSSTEMRLSALREIIQRLEKSGTIKESISDDPSKMRDVEETLRGAQIMHVGEYGRAVHAEMSALVCAARRGIAVDACTMYTTTFPCHNCTKHIVAAGISRVVYIEPYPKSLAAELHGRALNLDGKDEGRNAVWFDAFEGVAPRKFLEWFAVDGKRSVSGQAIDWKASKTDPRTKWPTVSAHYLAAEKTAVSELNDALGSE